MTSVRRSDFDVTNSVQVSSPRPVLRAVEVLYRPTWPGLSMEPLARAFEHFERLFAGLVPGYHGVDTVYHDRQHTLDITLALARLLVGYERQQNESGRLGGARAVVGLITGLFHDVGYLRRTDDRDSRNGAEFTRTHVSRGARDVGAGEFGAVARVAIVRAAQIPDVVKEPGDQAHHGARASEAPGLVLLTLVADQQPRERERDVERVLAIVIDGIDAVITGDEARKQPLEVLEGARERLHRQARPGRPVEHLDGAEHGTGRAHLHAVGDVEIAAPDTGHCVREHRPLSGTTPRPQSPRTARPALKGQSRQVGLWHTETRRTVWTGRLPSSSGASGWQPMPQGAFGESVYGLQPNSTDSRRTATRLPAAAAACGAG